jgi:glycoprotease/Kae1 family metallohydrolase
LVGSRGAGKSAIVSDILKHLSKTFDATDFGAITFIGVKEYTIAINDNILKVVHIDPDIKGHQRLTKMHSEDWDVLLLEHGQNNAFSEHNNIIKKMGDSVMDVMVSIEQDDIIRRFSLSSASGKPIETPPLCTWTGNLIEKKFSPDCRLSKKQVRDLRRQFNTKKVVILSVESSCDDTCLVIKCGDEIIYIFEELCKQGDQAQGKEGIDPFDTAKKHASNFERAMVEIKAKLEEKGKIIDLVSVTQGPGQAFALLEGIHFAQKIATELSVPIIYLDHIMGHAISPLLSPPSEAPKYPYLVFVVSGGHTVLLLVESSINMKIVYTSPDDAIGEVIDKVSRAIGLSVVPAGPVAEMMKNMFLDGKKELWKSITSKTTNVKIESTTPDVTEQIQLKEFRDVLEKLEKCKTPSTIKSMFNSLIIEQKLCDCDIFDLLNTFIKVNNLLDTITESELKSMTNLFKKAWNVKKEGTIKDVIERLRKIQPSGKYDYLVEEESAIPKTFAKFLDYFHARTILSIKQQQFYCACLHSVTLTYLGRHFLEAITKFPRVKHLSLGGGVACNVFLKEELKVMLEHEGRKFTVVPKPYCADNAYMMWKLTIETLKHIFTSGGECTCGEDEADCMSCETLRYDLLKHGCGLIKSPISKDNVFNKARDRWDESALPFKGI